jgi:hypothetical protein
MAEKARAFLVPTNGAFIAIEEDQKLATMATSEMMQGASFVKLSDCFIV